MNLLIILALIFSQEYSQFDYSYDCTCVEQRRGNCGEAGGEGRYTGKFARRER
jgi:hypothetical protein